MLLPVLYRNSAFDSFVSFDFFQFSLLLTFPPTDYKTRDSIITLVTDYLQNKINIDPLITHKLRFERINEAFELLQGGKW